MFDPFDMFDMFEGGGRRRFNPASVFAAGDVGWVYDTQNLASMFQDVAGTIPANLPGHPVAKRLDLSGRGNHATQSVAASRPTLARRPASGVRNLLTYTSFEGAVAGTPGTFPTAFPQNALGGSIVSVSDGTIVFAAIAARQIGGSSQVIAANATETWSVTITENTGLIYSQLFVLINQAGISSWTTYANGIVVTPTVYVPVAGDVLSIVVVNGGATSYPTMRIGVGAVGVATGQAGFKNPQREIGATATAYQRVGSIYDVTEAGQPDLWCLVTDGIDDGMVTPTITPAVGADKVQVVAGVRKLSDAAMSVLIELGTTVSASNGSFLLTTPRSPATAYGFASRGTTLAEANVVSANSTAVLTGLGDIAGDSTILRVNGAQVAASAADQGTGQFGTYPAYLYRRGGTTLPAKIEDYGMICRISTTNLSAAAIGQLETWANQRTGAF